MNNEIMRTSYDIILDTEKEGYFKAVASKSNIDIFKDIVEVKGIKVNFPQKACHNHDKNRQIGEVFKGYVSEENKFVIEGYLDLENKYNQVSLPEIQQIRRLAQEGKMFISIGYFPLKEEHKNINGENVRILKEVEITEFSFVLNPVNQECVFEEMKSIEALQDAGMMMLKDYYDNLDKQSRDEESKMEQELKGKCLNEIRTTTSKNQFEKNLSSYYKLPAKTTNSIVEETKSFYKRCDSKVQKEKEIKAKCEVKEEECEVKKLTASEMIIQSLKGKA